VAEDQTGDTVGLAKLIGEQSSQLGPCLLATSLSFAESRYTALQRYEQGYVKEGVGAGGCAIAAELSLNWDQRQLLSEIETLVEQLVVYQTNSA
jgi:NaMN:DMB phosphoribosyltransferase